MLHEPPPSLLTVMSGLTEGKDSKLLTSILWPTSGSEWRGRCFEAWVPSTCSINVPHGLRDPCWKWSELHRGERLGFL